MVFLLIYGVMYGFTRSLYIAEIATDNSGNTFLAFTYTIRKYDNKGKFVSQFGKYGEKEGQFYIPLFEATGGIENINIDKEGSLYVADGRSCRIQKFDNYGHFLFMFGKEGKEKGEFNKYTFDIAIDKERDIFVADTINDRVQRFDFQGNFLSQFRVDRPYSLSIDNEGNIYVTTRRNGKVKVFNKEGILLQEFGQGVLGSPASILVDSQGNVFVADSDREFQGIKRFTKDGRFLSELGGFTPIDFALKTNGNILVIDGVQKMVLEFDKEGKPINSKEIQALNKDWRNYLIKSKIFHLIKTGMIFVLAIAMIIFNIKMKFIESRPFWNREYL